MQGARCRWKQITLVPRHLSHGLALLEMEHLGCSNAIPNCARTLVSTPARLHRAKPVLNTVLRFTRWETKEQNNQPTHAQTHTHTNEWDTHTYTTLYHHAHAYLTIQHIHYASLCSDRNPTDMKILDGMLANNWNPNTSIWHIGSKTWAGSQETKRRIMCVCIDLNSGHQKHRTHRRRNHRHDWTAKPQPYQVSPTTV